MRIHLTQQKALDLQTCLQGSASNQAGCVLIAARRHSSSLARPNDHQTVEARALPQPQKQDQLLRSRSLPDDPFVRMIAKPIGAPTIPPRRQNPTAALRGMILDVEYGGHPCAGLRLKSLAPGTPSVAPYSVAVDGQLIRPSRRSNLVETDDGARKIPDTSCCGTESSGPRVRCRQARAPART